MTGIPVTIATLKAKPGKEQELEAAASALAAAVNANEEGCLQYDLCKGESAGEFVFIERYRDAEAVETHRKSDHFRTLGREMGAYMDGPPEIRRLTQV